MELEEKKRVFHSITAFGIHFKIKNSLTKMIQKEFKTKSVYFYEYFLDMPFIRNNNPKLSSFGPFLLRIINEEKRIPKIDESITNWQDVGYLPFTFDNIANFWNYSYKGARNTNIEEHTIIGEEMIKLWKKGEGEVDEDNKWIRYETSFDLVEGNFKFPIKYLREEYLREIKAKYDNISYIGALKEYLTTVHPWLFYSDMEYLNIAAFSISSNKLFYGVILIFYPENEYFNCKRGIFLTPKNGESETVKELKKIIKNSYVPILLLYENYWEEEMFKRELYSQPTWEDYLFLSPSLENSDNKMEKALYVLWTERKKFYEESSPRVKVIKTLEDNLVFSKYLIASFEMIKELEKVVIPRERLTGTDYLPSVLIIGGPGSGKDKISRAIPLFFHEYRFGRRYTINMAALKPDYLSVPLMSGGNIELVTINNKTGEKSSKFLLNGIFKKIWEQHKKEYPEVQDKENIKSGRKQGVMPVVILDELNSLDIDAQGALLRFLENASLQPLGGIDDEKVDFLIIGTVNEPEDVLTLQEPLQKFLIEKSIFGGILGKLFYEHFRGMRRLREDLYFRMVRDGKIKLLDLSERRTDIPILFTFFLQDELPQSVGWKNLWIDFDVFEELMKETIHWKGNFRQLQSVAKRTAQFALSDLENQEVLNERTFVKPFRVSLKHIEKVLEEFFYLEQRKS